MLNLKIKYAQARSVLRKECNQGSLKDRPVSTLPNSERSNQWCSHGELEIYVIYKSPESEGSLIICRFLICSEKEF